MTRQRRRGHNIFRPLLHLWLILSMLFSQGMGPAQFVRGAAQLAGPFVLRGAGVAAGVFAAAALFGDARAANSNASPSNSQIANAKAALQHAPVVFVQNVGQFSSSAHFQARTSSGTVWVADNAIWITALENPKSSPPTGSQSGTLQQSTPSSLHGVHLKLSFVGANPHPRIEPFDQLKTHVSYFEGNDPAKWHPDVPVWGGIRYVDLYPGVDLEVSGSGGQWQPRLVVRAGGNSSNVHWRIDGAQSVREENGQLRVTTAVGDLQLPSLAAVTPSGTVLSQIQPQGSGSAAASARPAQFLAQVDTSTVTTFVQRTAESTVSKVTAFLTPETAQAAIVDDPAALLYGTYLGGYAYDWAYGLAVDSSGNAYITGSTESSDFPTTPGAFDRTYNDTADGSSGMDVFVTKINADGSGAAYSTYLGSTSVDYGYGIVVDSSGNAYVTGLGGPVDFPTTPGAYSPAASTNSAFVTKLNPTGTALIYSTCIGGNSVASVDRGQALTLDASGAVYVTGTTSSTDFPTTAGAYSTRLAGSSDAFVTKLNAAGSALIYSTYLGGRGDDYGRGIALDGSGNAYVTGYTLSSNFPTTRGAYATRIVGGEDVFVSKLNTTGTGLVYSTYLGSTTGGNFGYAVAVDSAGSAYVTGEVDNNSGSSNSDFPTTSGALETILAPYGAAAFVTKLKPDGSGLVYSTFLGGGHDAAWSIVVDSTGAAYVSGRTSTPQFPTTTGAFDRSLNGSNGSYDAFVVRLNSSGSALLYGTYLGGSAWECFTYNDGEGACLLAVAPNGMVYVAGNTESTDFPITSDAVQAIDRGYDDVFVAKLNITVLSTETVTPALQAIGQTYRDWDGNLVDTDSGMYMYRKADLAIPGRGPSPTFVRAYNSADPVVGPLGPGWMDTYQSRIVSDGNGHIVVVNPDGRRDVYTSNGGGIFTPPVGVVDNLAEDPVTGIYTLRHKDQSIWTYDITGRLISIKDRYGNQSNLTYTNNQLTQVSDPANRGSLSFAYDTCFSGRLCSVTDWQSPARSVQFTYDSAGRLWKVTDRNGQVTTYGYDGTSSNLTTITDANNHVAITNTYDSQGRVITQKDALNQQTTFGYVTNPDGSATTTVTKPATSFDPNWQSQDIDSYDAQGRWTQRVSKPTSSESDTILAGYDSNFFTTSTMDARENSTQFCYDVDYSGASIVGSRGNLTRVIAPASLVGQNPIVTLYKYDYQDNLTETIPPKGVENGSTVSCTTDLSTSIDSHFPTDSAYDANGVYLLSVTVKYTDPDSGAQTATTKFEYNDASNPGLVTKVIPPRGNTGGTPDYSYATSSAYFGSGSQAGMLQSVTAPTTDSSGNETTSETTYTYDAVGHPLTMVDPNGNASGGVPADHTWSYSYDNEDRLASVSAPAPVSGGATLTTTYTYDPVGNLSVVKDANGQVTKYLYDLRDSLAEVDQSPSIWTDPNATPNPKYATTYSYDNNGNLSRVTRATGDANNERATDYVYDGFNQLRAETQYPAWPSTTSPLVTNYTYDANGNRQTLVDPLNHTTTYGYDAVNRLTSISYSDGTTPNVSYLYDANGNRTRMSDGTGQTTYLYDELDHLTTVTSPGNQVVGYRYDVDGNRTKVIYPDTTAVTYTFNKGNQLLSFSDWAQRQTSYRYYPDGSLQKTTNVNGTTATYSYDNALRLSQVLNQNGTTTISQHTYQTRDNVGNPKVLQEILSQVNEQTTTNTINYAYDALYQLSSDGVNTYTYDPVGNRNTENGVLANYDRADRIQSVGSTSYSVDANGNVTARGSDSFAYDQANRLKSATISGTTSTYAYDGDGNRASKTVGTTTTNYVYDVNASLPNVLTDGTLKYVYGLGLAYAVDGSGNLQVYHTDGLGSVRAITDGLGNLLETYQYDGFGYPTAAGPSTQPYQFTGQRYDTETKLLDLRARMYDPSTGRFLSRDPLSGSIAVPQSLNRYSYTQNNPTTQTDSSGLCEDKNDPWNCKDFAGRPAGVPQWVQARLPIDGGSGFDEDVSLGERAAEIHQALGEGTVPYDKRTTGVMRAIDSEGEIRIAVASSEAELGEEQRAVLRPGEIPVEGSAGMHAEKKLINYAEASGWQPIEIAASRRICWRCAVKIMDSGAFPVSRLKEPGVLEWYRSTWGLR